MAELENGAEAHVEHRVDDGGKSVLTLSGELDLSTVGRVEAAFERALSRSPELLVVDVSELGFIDSSGIALLIRASERVGRLELRCPTPILRRVIDVTGLTEILHIEP